MWVNIKLVSNIFGPKIQDQKFLVQKILGPKEIWSKKSRSKALVQKILCPKIFGTKFFGPLNFGYKRLKVQKNLSQKNNGKTNFFQHCQHRCQMLVLIFNLKPQIYILRYSSRIIIDARHTTVQNTAVKHLLLVLSCCPETN